jgi:hypothetical protein
MIGRFDFSALTHAMHIHWLAPISLDDPNQVYQTEWASLRLRAGALVISVQGKDHRAQTCWLLQLNLNLKLESV